MNQPVSIESGATQLVKASSVDSLDKYKGFYNEYFIPSIAWLDDLSRNVATLESYGQTATEDYYKLLAVTACFGAQYAYPSLDGNVLNYQPRVKLEVSHPRHQLSLICHSAYLALTAEEKKLKLRKIIEALDPNAAMGAYGLFLKSEKGQIKIPETYNQAQILLQAANSRLYESKRPIVLLDEQRAKQLARINFRPEDADQMVSGKVYSVVLPAVENAVGEFLNLRNAFTWRN